MAAEVIYMRSSRRLSSTGWRILNRAREVIQELPLFHSPPPTWSMNFRESEGERLEFSALVLHFLLTDIRAITHGFTEESSESLAAGLFAGRVLGGLLVLQSVRIPGMAQQTCLVCGSPVAARMPPRRNPARVSVERRHLSSCGYWTLQEISIFPALRDVDRPRLCTRHASRFSRGLEALLGFVDPPVRTLERRRRRSFLLDALESAIREADSEPSS